MIPSESSVAEPQLQTRRDAFAGEETPSGPRLPGWMTSRRTVVAVPVVVVLLVVLGIGGYFYAQHWVRAAAMDALPQVDGTLAIPGLSGPVTVARDAHSGWLDG